MVRLERFESSALRTLRRSRGLTQKELAARVGTTRRAVERWESGTGAPDATVLPALAAALACRSDQLLRPVVVDTLATLRERAGLSQRTLAARLDINQSSLSRIENGTFALNPRLVRPLAIALGVTQRDVRAAYEAARQG